MQKGELIQKNLCFLLKKAEEFHFPEFLKELRKTHGLSRRTVCKDLSISEMRMFWLEHGFFKKGIPEEELDTLASYYAIPSPVLLNRYHVFMSQAKNDPSLGYTPKRARKQA